MSTQAQLKAHDKIHNDLPFFARNCLQISTKQGGRTNFEFNRAQKYAHIKLEDQIKVQGQVRALALKGRQQGFSTYTAGRYFQKNVTQKNKNTFILSHDSQTTQKLFDMVDTFYKHLPEPIKPGLDTKNSRRLVFADLESSYTVGTAGNAEVGRGGTLQLFHGSEVAFWENTDNLDTGLLQSVADLPGTEIILESTANGASGYFYEKYMIALDGGGDYIPIFIPWFWQDEYRKQPSPDFKLTEEEEFLQRTYNLDMAQMYWRRKKIEDFRKKEWKFKQEYPCDAMEAFQTSGEKFFTAKSVVEAMNNLRPDETGAPLIITLDPSGGGKDTTAFGWRRGRDFYKYDEIEGNIKDPQFQMYVVGRTVKIINDDDPDMVFIDRGYGDGIIARLHELGYGKRVMGVGFADGAMDPDRYANKRAEMHDLGREWLEQIGVSIPNERKMQKQLLAVPMEKLTSSSKMLIVPKDEVKKNNNGESPGILDIFILSFAYPVKRRDQRVQVMNKPNTFQAQRNQSSRSPLLTMRGNSGQNRRNNNIHIIRAMP